MTKAIGIVALVACGCGCVYRHRVVNVGQETLYAVTVQAGEQKFGHGVLASGCTAGYIGRMRIRRDPPPLVWWRREEGGALLSQEVVLDRDPGTREVVFELDGYGVKGYVRPAR